MAANMNPAMQTATGPKQRGYPKLASLMGHHTETAIFRRFGQLNMLNLLSLQAELTDLELQLQYIRQEDQASDDPLRMLHTIDFWELRQSRKAGDDLQWQTLLNIRRKLQEYSTAFKRYAALLQISQLAKIDSPREDEMNFLQDWLERPMMGNSFLRGREATVWRDRTAKEMVLLAERKLDSDPFSTWLSTGLVSIFDRVWGNRRKNPILADPDSGIVEYDNSRLSGISNAVTVTFASLVPTVSVLALNYVCSTQTKLGLLILFTALFSAALAAFTTARKIEIFSAVAAFAAVEVVFIGSSGNNSASCP